MGLARSIVLWTWKFLETTGGSALPRLSFVKEEICCANLNASFNNAWANMSLSGILIPFDSSISTAIPKLLITRKALNLFLKLL